MPEQTGYLRTLLVVGAGLLISGIVTVSVPTSTTSMMPHGPMGGIETMVLVKLFVATLNVVLLLVLLWNYANIYRELPNRFTLSLLIVTVALLLYALSSNPLVPLVMGFQHGAMLGPFTFLPDVFATVAIVILLYQSYS